jgi:hypothetical protein
MFRSMWWIGKRDVSGKVLCFDLFSELTSRVLHCKEVWLWLHSWEAKRELFALVGCWNFCMIIYPPPETIYYHFPFYITRNSPFQPNPQPFSTNSPANNKKLWTYWEEWKGDLDMQAKHCRNYTAWSLYTLWASMSFVQAAEWWVVSKFRANAQVALFYRGTSVLGEGFGEGCTATPCGVRSAPRELHCPDNNITT